MAHAGMASRLPPPPPPPGICHKELGCVTASDRRQAGSVRCSQSVSESTYGPEVKWLKSRGGNVLCRRCPHVASAALMTRTRGARSCTNDTRSDTKPFPRVILAVPSPSDRWMDGWHRKAAAVAASSCYSSGRHAGQENKPITCCISMRPCNEPVRKALRFFFFSFSFSSIPVLYCNTKERALNPLLLCSALPLSGEGL
jgi:hypothetical protein